MDVSYPRMRLLNAPFFSIHSHSRLFLCVFFAPKLHNSGKLLLLCLCVCVFIRFFSSLCVSPISIGIVAFALVRGAILAYSYISYRSFFFLAGCYFHFMAIVVDFPLNDSNCERTFGGWIGCEVCVSLYLSLSIYLRVCVVVGRHCNRYYYVRYRTISIIGYQNCCRTWWWHCCYCLLSLCVCVCFGFVRPSKPIFRCAICYAQFHTETLNIYTHTTNIRHFFVRFELICIFVSISHFNFVTLFSLSLSRARSQSRSGVGVRGKGSSARLPYLIFFDWCHNSNSIRTLGF